MSKKSYFDEVIKLLKRKKISKDELSKVKTKLCKKHGLKKIPTDIEIMLNAHPKDVDVLKKKLLTKPTRSLSGVSVVAVMTRPRKCPHGACIMCPSKVDDGVPQSYTGKEPATRRALRNKFDPYLQVMNRLEQYVVTGHSFDKIELIIMGGTFPAAPKSYREGFVKGCFKAMNDFSRVFFAKEKFDIIKFKQFFMLPGDINDEKRTKEVQRRVLELKNKKGKGISLVAEQNYNDKHSKIKCVGMTIETRSDYAKKKHADDMLKLGCTRVELGIQSVYDDVLREIQRGHGVKENIEAIQTLKDMAFKLNFHYMPGLPGVDYKKDLEGLKRLFTGEAYRPDMLKIYPCMVVKDSKLYKKWKQGKFKPLSTKRAAKLISEFKEYVPEYCRIMRVQRDIPTYMTEAGVDMTNLRQYITQKHNPQCRCIRCRQFKKEFVDVKKVKLYTEVYDASHGTEFFISAETEDKVLGFCRLRFPGKGIRKEITANSALVRELHVYGEAVKLGGKGKIQHLGLGKMLLARAEEIAENYHRDKVVVISGVGVREYYRKLGYKLTGSYMVKKF